MFEVTGRQIVNLKVNGGVKSAVIRGADTLLDVLRKQFGLTGAKNGCETGDCGACTVLLDGYPAKACLMLAVEGVDREITTVEGLCDAPIQKAFVEKFALQCGGCTPGMIMNCHALVNSHPDATDEIIEEWLESNICRCTGYEEIKNAVKSTLNR